MPRAPRKRSDATRALLAAVRVLDRRVRKCEQALGLQRRRVGFQVDAVGDRVEQDEDDGFDHVPDECSAGRRGRN